MLIEEDYKFAIYTRPLKLVAEYAETEFKSIRFFCAGLKESTQINIDSVAKLIGEDNFSLLNFRHGQDFLERGEITADCLTAYVPINVMHFGEWIALKITGIAQIDIKYRGIEVNGIKRREYSNWVLTDEPIGGGGLW
jgi:hypothetical protein